MHPLVAFLRHECRLARIGLQSRPTESPCFLYTYSIVCASYILVRQLLRQGEADKYRWVPKLFHKVLSMGTGRAEEVREVGTIFFRQSVVQLGYISRKVDGHLEERASELKMNQV